MSIFKKKEKADLRDKKIARINEERKNILTLKSGFYQREAYKTLRTNVNFALTDTEDCKTIIVTSAMQSEGKSLTSLNLAISLAQTDKKVLLIDCDLRRPKLGRLLNVASKTGLSNLLVQPDNFGKALHHSDAHGIDFILSGDIPPNPSELLASARMQSLLEQLHEKYDYIIMDTPPVDMVIDAVVLAPLTDGILFVVRANQSERGALIHAMTQLEYAKAKVLGFVLNGVSDDAGAGYGKYRYRRYGRYGRYGRYSRYGYNGSYGYKSGYGYGYGYSSAHRRENETKQEPAE